MDIDPDFESFDLNIYVYFSGKQTELSSLEEAALTFSAPEQNKSSQSFNVIENVSLYATSDCQYKHIKMNL